MKRVVILAVLAVGTQGVGGCSSGGGGISPIDLPYEGTSLTELTEAQAEKVCGRIKAKVRERREKESRQGCIFVGWMAENPEICKQVREWCLDASDEEVVGSMVRWEAACVLEITGASGCTATVGDLEECINAEVDLNNRRFSHWSSIKCSTTDEEFDELDMDWEELYLEGLPSIEEACGALEPACPNLY